MREQAVKYLFLAFAGLLLIIMIYVSRDAGITCDEVLHYDHSLTVYNFFASHGTDRSVLNTPLTHLKYYGQSYDNLVTIIIKWLHIDNVYGFRHLMSPLAGWLAIMATALFAIWLSGYRTGIIVILLFAVSPTFLGHSENNLKDIPFALGYIAGTFFICRFIYSAGRNSLKHFFFLTAAIAFTISIRAGGLLLICYLFFFWFLFVLYRFVINNEFVLSEIRKQIVLMIAISVFSWLIGILLWPFALLSPVSHVLESYRAMAHFPGTFRQIFEGRVEWSDFMPWYYLIKSMAITIPLLVIAGVVLFFIFSKKILSDNKVIFYIFLLFSLFFPLFFVIYEKSNLYSSWRQFLFLYPPIVLLAATGIRMLLDHFRQIKFIVWSLVLLAMLTAFHPVKFMVQNHRYAYIYYNQLVGGLRGAYGNYETDYYYVSQTEASKWLLDYLKDKKEARHLKVKATYSVSWLFRKHPEIETSYFRFAERSMSDWDYAIIVNRYIPPYYLKKGFWPPKNSIHTIYADKVPVCAVVERKSKDDLNGYNALIEGRSDEAVEDFEKALTLDDKDEMVYYNYATALYNSGQKQKADSVLRKSLEINPDFELALMYLGNIAGAQNNTDEAIACYEKVIKADRKYFEAYVVLAKLLADRNIAKSRELLRSCLELNPGYKEAIVALAETYRISNPDIARKYDELANSISQ
jgi:tetratricopeptide (TPR) repeat protein